jgi:hemolysin III
VRFLDRFYEPVSGFTHLGGAILAAIGMVILISMTWDTPTKMVSVIVYSISTILCFSASTTLHLSKVSEKTRLWLVRFDHASIYIMIAGTYTPLIYNVLTDEGWKWGSLWGIWLLAAVGIVYKLFLYNRPHHLSTIMYVAMGWLGLLLIPHALPLISPAATILIVAGGIVYTVGAVIFALRRPNFHRYFGHHELWHIFVLGGCALHFVAVMMILN